MANNNVMSDLVQRFEDLRINGKNDSVSGNSISDVTLAVLSLTSLRYN